MSSLVFFRGFDFCLKAFLVFPQKHRSAGMAPQFFPPWPKPAAAPAHTLPSCMPNPTHKKLLISLRANGTAKPIKKGRYRSNMADIARAQSSPLSATFDPF